MSKNFELMRSIDGGRRVLSEVNNARSPQTFKPNQDLGNKDDAHNWGRALFVLRTHWRVSALFAAVVIITVALINFAMTPIYEPEARIEVDPPGSEAFSMQSGSSTTSESEYMETQAQIMGSDALALAVIRKMRLDTSPEFVGARGTTQNGYANLAPQGYQLTPSENIALKAFKERLKVKRDSGSRIITLSFGSSSPQVAAAVTNTVSNTFVNSTFESRHNSILQSTEWLSRQLDDIRTRMEQSRRALADFQKDTGLADLDSNKSTFSDLMGELNRQLTQAKADRMQLQALLARVEQENAQTLPEVNSNPVMQELTKKLADLKSELSQTSVIYGKNHPNVKKLESQVESLETQLAAQRAVILSQLKTSYAAARAREDMMSGQIKDTSKELSLVAKYNALKKEAQANEDLYNSLYAKVKEAGIAAASKSSNVRIIDEARVLDSPTRPRRMRNLGLGILVGVFGGLMIAFIKDRLDTGVHTPQDVREWTGISSVSVLPYIDNNSHQLRDTRRILGLRRQMNLAPADKFLLERPSSVESEAMRGLQTAVMLSGRGLPPQVILIASAFQAEGKTTVAVNLAIALARNGKTCLVDADLRRPSVCRAFHIQPTSGLGSVLLGDLPLEEAFINIPEVSNLVLLPAGSPAVNAGELLSSNQMPSVIQDLRHCFNHVIVDSPPILQFADGRLLSPYVDGIVFVGRPGVTTRGAMLRSLEILSEVHAAPIIDVVLNGVDFDVSDYRHYNYGYR
jgi:succinoglycan biosynthesis transport protein ExoP